VPVAGQLGLPIIELDAMNLLAAVRETAHENRSAAGAHRDQEEKVGAMPAKPDRLVAKRENPLGVGRGRFCARVQRHDVLGNILPLALDAQAHAFDRVLLLVTKYDLKLAFSEAAGPEVARAERADSEQANEGETQDNAAGSHGIWRREGRRQPANVGAGFVLLNL
jgi:hypothetical protein